MRKLELTLCVLIALPFALVARAQPARDVQMTVIGSYPGAQWTVPTAINDHGTIVGHAININSTGQDASFIWTRAAGFQLFGETATLSDVNNRGDIAGARETCELGEDGNTTCFSRGFIWNQRTGFIDLGQLLPNAINNHGDVAGRCGDAACAIRRGTLSVWPCGVFDCGTDASAINDRGDVTVNRFSPVDDDQNFTSIMTRTGDSILLEQNASAEDINNAGAIAGRSESGPTIWIRETTLTPSGAIPGVFQAINDPGLAVGWHFDTNRAIVWDSKRNVLTTLEGTGLETAARDVNNRGEIVGSMFLNGAIQQMVIWTVHPALDSDQRR